MVMDKTEAKGILREQLERFRKRLNSSINRNPHG